MQHAYDVFANTADGVVAVDRRQRVILWNSGSKRILGYSPREALGRPCYEVICGRAADGRAVCRPNCRMIRSARRLERAANADVRACTKDGRDVWLNVLSVVVPSRGDGMAALVHLFHELQRPRELDVVVEQLAGSLARLTSALPPHTDDTKGTCQTDDFPSLTPRELEVLRLLAEALSTEEIAGRLFISPRTVRNHVQNLLEKLGAHSRLEAVTVAHKRGLI